MSEIPPEKPSKPSKPGVKFVEPAPEASETPTVFDTRNLSTSLEESETEAPAEPRPSPAYNPSRRSVKNVRALLEADADDESLRRYKESLLGAAAHGDLGDTSDPRKLIVTEFRVIFSPEENLPDIVHNLDSSEGLARLASTGITIREGAKYKFRLSFRVQHEILSGVKFVNTVTKMVFSETSELTIGSYPPSSSVQVFEFPKWDYEEAPKGMFYRGTYRSSNAFIDTDKVTHLTFNYDLHITK